MIIKHYMIKIFKIVSAVALCINPLTWKIWWAPNNASKWQMGFNSAFKGLSRLHCLHHGCASHSPAENLWTLIALYAKFTLSVSTTPSFHFVSKTILETKLGEALNDKEIYLKSGRRTQLVNPGFCCCMLAGIVSLNPAGSMDVCSLWMLCVACWGLCDRPIRGPKGSYRVYVYHCVQSGAAIALCTCTE